MRLGYDPAYIKKWTAKELEELYLFYKSKVEQ